LLFGVAIKPVIPYEWYLFSCRHKTAPTRKSKRFVSHCSGTILICFLFYRLGESLFLAAMLGWYSALGLRWRTITHADKWPLFPFYWSCTWGIVPGLRHAFQLGAWLQELSTLVAAVGEAPTCNLAPIEGCNGPQPGRLIPPASTRDSPLTHF
jgi:hypothetical protein